MSYRVEFVTRREDANGSVKQNKKRFYTVGYKDGYAHGRIHGLIEGRALGAEKGFELWEELGFYEGAARLWAAIFSTDSSGTDACVSPSSSLLARPSAFSWAASLIQLRITLFSFCLFPIADAAPTTRPRCSR